MKFDLEAFLREGVIFSSTEGSVIVGWGQRTWMKIPSKKHPISFYFPDFFLSESTPWCIHEYVMEFELEDLQALLFEKKSSFSPIKWQSFSKEIFEKEFEELSLHFKGGSLQKAVPYIHETTEQFYAKHSLAHSLCNMFDFAKLHPVYLYGFWSDGEGMLGATPELLFSQKKNLIDTMACAGTFPEEKKNQIENDPKIAQEHQLVVQGIVENLSHLGTLTLKPTETCCFPLLCHRVTQISLLLNKQTPFQKIVEALHPTPALGVHPKSSGKFWLKEYEKRHPRKRFGAPAGFSFHEGDATCYVAIRNVQWSGNKAYLLAGCGVIPESSCEGEWNELQLKIHAIKRMLAMTP